MTDYLAWLRSRVGQVEVVLTFVACILQNQDGHILLQQRSDSGLWGFPGGLIEPGESVSQAAVREVLEETGWEAMGLELVGVYSGRQESYPSGDVASAITIFLAGKLGRQVMTKFDAETSRIAILPTTEVGPLFNSAHVEAFDDYKAGVRGTLN